MNALADEEGRRVAVEHLERRHLADEATVAAVVAQNRALWGLARAHTCLSDADIALRVGAPVLGPVRGADA